MLMATPADDAKAKRAGSTSHVWGYVLVLGSGLFFITSMCVRLALNLASAVAQLSTASFCSYWMLLSKLLPALDKALGYAQPQTPGLLSAMETDTYYCYLVPLTIPITMVACYANWVSLKFFRHN